MILKKLSEMLIPWWVYAILFVALLAGTAVGTFTLTATYKDAVWSNEISKIKQDGAEKLLEHTQATRALELEAAKQNTASEVANRERQNQIDLLREDNRLLIASGGLRDPGAKPKSCPATVSGESVASVDEGETSDGRLSKEAEEFLWRFAYDADRAAVYATGCWERENKPNEVAGEFTKVDYLALEYDKPAF